MRLRPGRPGDGGPEDTEDLDRNMHLARWLTAAALTCVLAAPLPGCRDYIRPPFDAGPLGGSGGTGGTGGTGGVAGILDTGRPPPPDAVDQSPPEAGRDAMIPDT